MVNTLVFTHFYESKLQGNENFYIRRCYFVLNVFVFELPRFSNFNWIVNS